MAKKENPYKPTVALYFRKPRKEELCRIEQYKDGSVFVTGGGKAAGIYEGTEDCLEKAVAAVEKGGYVRVPDPYAK